MTQKANLFKGQQNKKSVPPNHPGKPSVTRKGKRFVKPAKVTKEMDVDRGCDASVLLASRNRKSEKDGPDNISLAGDGFDTVIKPKAAVDRVPRCKNKVSCADILAIATRDVVHLGDHTML